MFKVNLLNNPGKQVEGIDKKIIISNSESHISEKELKTKNTKHEKRISLEVLIYRILICFIILFSAYYYWSIL